MLVNEDSFRYCWRGLEEGHGRVGCSPAGRQGFSSTFSVWLQRLDTLDMWCYAIQEIDVAGSRISPIQSQSALLQHLAFVCCVVCTLTCQPPA